MGTITNIYHSYGQISPLFLPQESQWTRTKTRGLIIHTRVLFLWYSFQNPCYHAFEIVSMLLKVVATRQHSFSSCHSIQLFEARNLRTWIIIWCSMSDTRTHHNWRCLVHLAAVSYFICTVVVCKPSNEKTIINDNLQECGTHRLAVIFPSTEWEQKSSANISKTVSWSRFKTVSSRI
jgi:hypothetical protein